jgi:hypothetical protein
MKEKMAAVAAFFSPLYFSDKYRRLHSTRLSQR